MKEIREFDVLIIGGGCSGLLLARRALRDGLTVGLVERNPTLAAAPSTRNEGWLHSGCYHSWAIEDGASYRAVAQRCIYGAQRIMNEFPGSVAQEYLARSFAVLPDDSGHDRLMARWLDAGVQFSPVPLEEARSHAPSLHLLTVQRFSPWLSARSILGTFWMQH